MKFLVLVLLAAGLVLASTNLTAPVAGIPGEGSRAALTILDSFDMGALGASVYCVGLGYDGTNLWVSNNRSVGGLGTNQIMVITITSPHTLVTSFDQNSTSSWGVIDMAYDAASSRVFTGRYDSTNIDYYSASSYVKQGSFVGHSGGNYAIACNGMDFYVAGGFAGTNMYKGTWNGVSGSTLTWSTWSTACPNNGQIGAAYDAAWPCIWLSTASGTGILGQLAMDGSLITTYALTPEVANGGGCEMAPFSAQSQLWMLAQTDPNDTVYCWDVRSTSLSRDTWGSIKTLF